MNKSLVRLFRVVTAKTCTQSSVNSGSSSIADIAAEWQRSDYLHPAQCQQLLRKRPVGGLILGGHLPREAHHLLQQRRPRLRILIQAVEAAHPPHQRLHTFGCWGRGRGRVMFGVFSPLLYDMCLTA